MLLSETNVLEALGRKQLQLEAQDSAYSNLLSVLAKVVSGEIARSRVLVNLTDRTWGCAEAGKRPALPATINGQPVCIVAPQDPVQGSLEAIAAYHAESGVTQS